MAWLKAHRVLIVVYTAMLVLAVFERSNPRIQEGRTDEPEVYLAPDTNIADVSAALYPDRALTLWYRAYQASLCSERPKASEVCRRRGPVAPGEVRRLIESSLATGNRSLELAMYNYARLLVQEGAPDEEVEAAILAWRTAHPGAARPDPRDLRRARPAGHS